MEIAKRKEVAIRACKEAGAILLANFGRRLSIKSKGDRDLVTNIDERADRLITGLIKRNFPDDGRFSEESPHSASGSGYRWIIDPIDGTHNFVHQIAIFGISCAVEFKGEVILGVIYLPWTQELYFAQKGKGAYRNGKRIAVSPRSLEETTLIYDSSVRYQPHRMLSCLGRLADKVFNIRMFGSTVRSLTYVAEGKAEAEIEFNDKVWDFAAGLLLIEEAGGRCTDFSGCRWTTATGGYIASNGIVHKKILEIIKKGSADEETLLLRKMPGVLDL